MSRPYFVRGITAGKSSFAEKSDEVSVKDGNGNGSKEEDDKKDKTPAKSDVTVTVDEEGIADRIDSLPVTPGSYYRLVDTKEGLYYSSRHQGNTGFKFLNSNDKKETDTSRFGRKMEKTDRKK